MPVKVHPMPEPDKPIVERVKDLMAKCPDLVEALAQDDCSLIRDLPTDEKPVSKDPDSQAS